MEDSSQDRLVRAIMDIVRWANHPEGAASSALWYNRWRLGFPDDREEVRALARKLYENDVSVWTGLLEALLDKEEFELYVAIKGLSPFATETARLSFGT